MADVDMMELNEAFAAQSIAVIRELGVDPQKVKYSAQQNDVCMYRVSEWYHCHLLKV